MNTQDRIYVDLTEYSSKYQGGVSTFARGIAIGLAKLAEKEGLRICLILENKTEWNGLIEDYNLDLSIITVNRPVRRRITNVLHRVNYNIINSYYVFALIKKLEFSHRIKYSLRNEVIYCPTTYLNLKVSNAFSIVSIHDCQEKKFPENFSRKQLLYRKYHLRFTLRNASIIQVSSKFISDELKFYFPELLSNSNSPKICEIPEGVDIKFFHPQKYASREKTTDEILVPLSFHPHKNHQELLEALKILDGKRSIRVYLTGEGPMKQKCIEFTNSFMTIDCQFVGYVTREYLLELYQRVNVVVVTSKYESSSLPILESLACNTRVLASDIKPHIEAKYKLALPIELYQLGNARELANKLEHVLDLKNIKGIFRRVLPFSWENIAEHYAVLFGQHQRSK